MKRRRVIQLGGGMVAAGVIGVQPALAGGAITHPPGATTDRGNWIRGRASDVTVTDVLEQTADPAAANFEEEFTFYRVTFESQEYTTWVYREPARLGGENFVAEHDPAVTSGRFWYGVSAPDADGIQHEITHKGQAIQYFETADSWTEMTASFDGRGTLRDVNGVQPE